MIWQYLQARWCCRAQKPTAFPTDHEDSMSQHVCQHGPVSGHKAHCIFLYSSEQELLSPRLQAQPRSPLPSPANHSGRDVCQDVPECGHKAPCSPPVATTGPGVMRPEYGPSTTAIMPNQWSYDLCRDGLEGGPGAHCLPLHPYPTLTGTWFVMGPLFRAEILAVTVSLTSVCYDLLLMPRLVLEMKSPAELFAIGTSRSACAVQRKH